MITLIKREIFPYWRTYIVLLTPLILLPLLTVYNSPESRCGYILIIMSVFWSTEALPIPVTSLMPVVLLPLLGIMQTNDVCLLYMKHTNMMLLGSLILAIGVEYCNLHRRIALFIILHVGQSPGRLLAGFMITTMFLSMWIANTASTALMVPITEAIINEMFSVDKQKDSEIHGKSEKSSPCVVKKQDSTSIEENSITEHEMQNIPDSKIDLIDDDQLSQNREAELSKTKNRSEAEIFRVALLLGVAYGANLGGTGTVSGSGPNLVLYGLLEDEFSEPTGMNYATWMAYNIPGMLLASLLGWILIQLYWFRFGKYRTIQKWPKEKEFYLRKVLEEKIKGLGAFTFHEGAVLICFITLVLLWFFREPEFIHGWGELFENAYGEEFIVNDATVALLMVIILFILPKSPQFWCFNKQGAPAMSTPACLDWKYVQLKMGWGILLLLGGGFAMAEATKISGLSEWLGEQLVALDVLPPAAIVFIVCLMVTFLTEVTSNSATAAIILPVLKNLALGIEVNPIYLMLPATVCCSYAFMLPVATPPNAIVHAAGNMKSGDMIYPGLIMNFLCICVATLMINTLGIPLFGVNHFPSWANSTNSSYIE